MTTVPATHRAKKLAIHFGADARSRVDAMLDRQNLTRMAKSVREVPGGAIGCLGNVSLPPQGNACFFTGLPIHGPDVARLTNADAATRLFPEWDGAFAGLFWDAQRQVLVIATDCLGMQPLYIRQQDGELTLVSETKALAGEPDLAAWGAFISIGHPIGDRSLMADLRRVTPASVLTYDAARRKLEIHRYWDWPEPSDAWMGFDFPGALERDIRAYASFGDPGTVLLSGGFDSRLLLSVIRRAGVPADALIVTHDDERGDADGRLAETVARRCGVPYRKQSPPPDFFSSPAYLDYVRDSDAGHPSLDLFIAKVASQIRSAAVWDGLAPGFMFMPLHQPEGGFDAYVRKEVHGPGSVGWQATKSIFRPEVARAMQEGFQTDLRTEIGRLPQDMYGLARFVIENRSRNRPAMNPLKVYANRCNSFTPGLSRDFITHGALIPFREKREANFYRRLFLRLDPQLAAIPFLSGGDLMRGAGAGGEWRYQYEYMRERLERFRTRHPSLFPFSSRQPTTRSRFLEERLFVEGDPLLDPDLPQRLRHPGESGGAAWKLLFHWKAWRWVHEGRLAKMLGADGHPG